MLYQINHTTTYDYSEPATLCQNLGHLTPRDTSTQNCRASHLSILPEAAVLSTRLDYFGNSSTYFTVQRPHRQLVVAAEHLVEVVSSPIPDPAATLPWDQVSGLLRVDLDPQILDASQYLGESRYVRPTDDISRYAGCSFLAGRPLLEAALDLTERIHRDFIYDSTATTVVTSLTEVLEQRRGVCQDFAHLQIACLRSQGLAARYVSGYLNTIPPPGCQPLVGADATHAWLSIFCPGIGWIDLDPTNNQIPSDRHITLAWGRDYDDVSPIKGIVLGGGQHSVHVAVAVTAAPEPELTAENAE